MRVETKQEVQSDCNFFCQRGVQIIDRPYCKWFSIKSLSVEFKKDTIFLFDSLIQRFLLHLVYDENVLRLRKECFIGEDLQRMTSLNFDKIKKQLNFSGISAYHEIPVALPKTRDFQLDDLSTVKKLSMTTLMEEEVKPRVIEKWESEYRGRSKLSSFFGNLDHQRSDAKSSYFKVRLKNPEVEECCRKRWWMDL